MATVIDFTIDWCNIILHSLLIGGFPRVEFFDCFDVDDFVDEFCACEKGNIKGHFILQHL
jgi:hypothetical protein